MVSSFQSRWLVLCLALPLAAQHRIDAFAGGKLRSGVPAQELALAFTQGITRDPAGNLVFAETGSNVIRRILRDGIIETIAGNGLTGFAGDGGSATAATLNGPAYPRYDGAGNLYFADANNYRIRRVDTRGVITSIAGTGVFLRNGMDLEGPALLRSIDSAGDLAVEPSGVVFFSEPEGDVIRRIDRNGNITVFAGIAADGCNCSDGDGGPAAKAHLDFPRALALDPSGNLYFGSAGGRVRRIAPDGTITKFAGYGNQPPLRNPPPEEGIPAIGAYLGGAGSAPLAAGPDGSLYVADPGFPNPARIRRIDPAGVITTFGGTRILSIGAIAFYDGNIAFTDPGRVGVFGPGETFTIVAGGNPKPAPDGTPAADAWLLAPVAIAFHSSGELYFAESGGCRIRKVDINRLLQTVAGTGKCSEAFLFNPAKGPDLPPPASIALDRQNRIYMSDVSGNFYRIEPDGSISNPSFPPVIGPAPKLAIDARNRVYVMGMFSLSRISEDGKVETIAGAPTSPGVPPAGFGPTSLRGLGVDPSGTAYFTGTYLGDSGDSVFRVNDDGTITRLFQGVYNTLSLAVDARGTAWQADGGLSVIDGRGMHQLGLGYAGYSGDGGPLQSARMNATAIAFSPAGDLFVVDGNRIRKVSGTDPAARPAISPGGIVNALSYVGGAIAPGEILSIFGSNFGGGLEVNPPVNNLFSLTLGNARVTIDGRYVPILALTATQINVIAPAGLEPGKTVEVVVQVDTALSDAAMVPVAAAVFGLGAATVVNQDGSVNSPANAAPQGSVVSLFGTGAGAMAPALFQGAMVISTPYPAAVEKVVVNIGGQQAEILYAGSAPLQPYGLDQINVRIPVGLTSGPQPMSVTVAGLAPARAYTIVVR